MNQLSPNPEEVIDRVLPGMADDLLAPRPQLSTEALLARAEDLRGLPDAWIRAGILVLLAELELYRLGYDCGREDGYAQAIADLTRRTRCSRRAV